MNAAFGLYLHIPFCRQRCHFCAFYLEVHRDAAAEAFVRALQTELRLYAAEEITGGRPVQSLYFGGGTPTMLSAAQLTAILKTVRQFFALDSGCEITVEAHPGTVTVADLSALQRSGVTRVSFGAESMQDAELAAIGRPGAQAETIAAVQAARSAGFTNINLDLMYGLPGQTIESWTRTLDACCALSPSHLSCYALTVEEGTRFANDIRRDPGRAPDETLQNEMDDIAQRVLRGAGYQRYEISNYALAGFECRHNLLYWTQGDYLGVGPSAQSFMGGVRFGNAANLAAYQSALEKGRLPVEERIALTPEEQLRDAVIFGLRLHHGIPTSQLNGHAANYGRVQVVKDLREGNLIEEEGERTRLSAQGRRHADTVAEKLF
ncbi:MAG TPA: radical SAM family heme chaperone HemW [Nitrospira sp.]|nr:radical SAM family heme chaperone HemW [Nitrospira sp.]